MLHNNSQNILLILSTVFNILCYHMDGVDENRNILRLGLIHGWDTFWIGCIQLSSISQRNFWSHSRQEVHRLCWMQFVRVVAWLRFLVSLGYGRLTWWPVLVCQSLGISWLHPWPGRLGWCSHCNWHCCPNRVVWYGCDDCKCDIFSIGVVQVTLLMYSLMYLHRVWTDTCCVLLYTIHPASGSSCCLL